MTSTPLFLAEYTGMHLFTRTYTHKFTKNKVFSARHMSTTGEVYALLFLRVLSTVPMYVQAGPEYESGTTRRTIQMSQGKETCSHILHVPAHDVDLLLAVVVHAWRVMQQAAAALAAVQFLPSTLHALLITRYVVEQGSLQACICKCSIRVCIHVGQRGGATVTMSS